MRRYQRPIAAYVYRMVGNYESALDLTQEIFIKVYSSLERYRAEFKFSTGSTKSLTTPRSIICAALPLVNSRWSSAPKAINSISRSSRRG